MYQALGIGCEVIWSGDKGGCGEKNSSERSKFFFKLRAIKCQKHEILGTKQFIDSIRLFRYQTV